MRQARTLIHQAQLLELMRQAQLLVLTHPVRIHIHQARILELIQWALIPALMHQARLLELIHQVPLRAHTPQVRRHHDALERRQVLASSGRRQHQKASIPTRQPVLLHQAGQSFPISRHVQWPRNIRWSPSPWQPIPAQKPCIRR